MPSLRKLTSTKELRERAVQWDSLWHTSEVAVPTSQAELVALIAEFDPEGPFRALAVEEGGNLLAALPLQETEWKGLRILKTLNPWTPSCDLLLHPEASSDVLDVLLEGLTAEEPLFVQLENIPLEKPWWARFRESVKKNGHREFNSKSYDIGEVEVGNWETYFSSLHREEKKSLIRRAKKWDEGEARLRTYRPKPEEVEGLLREGFSIEEKSWKGNVGTAVLKDEKLWKFYLTQAKLLCQRKQLELHFLEYKGTAVAFGYVYITKDRRFTAKVGYDPAYKDMGPGQELRRRFLQYAFKDPLCKVVDFHGRLVHWNSVWATRKYPVGNVTISTRQASSRTVVSLLKLRRRIGSLFARFHKAHRA